MNKKEIRKAFFDIRDSIARVERKEFNKDIFSNFINSTFIRKYDLFLIYVSVKSEVDTLVIIDYLLKTDKKVAVPHCDGNVMSFYIIKSINDLVDGVFGIPSVDISKSERVENFDKALCIVPGVSFDNNFNRLGYGGGYYDRFLSDNNITTLGLCYERCIADNLPAEDHDIKMDYVLTESCLRINKNKEGSTYG